MFNTPLFFSFIEDFVFIYENSGAIVDTIMANINFIDVFPLDKKIELYYDSYYLDIKESLLIEPRYYWQYELNNKAIINLNTKFNWIYLYPELYNYSLLEKSFLNLKEDYHFYTKFNFLSKSIFEANLYPVATTLHHDYASRYILTHNFFLPIISSNVATGLTGLHLCYYEPFGSIEIFLQPSFSIWLEIILPEFKFFTIGDPGMLIKIKSDMSRLYYNWYFYSTLDRVNYKEMLKYPLESILIRYPLEQK